MKSSYPYFLLLCTILFSDIALTQAHSLPMENALWAYDDWADGAFISRKYFAPDSLVIINQKEYAIINETSMFGWDYIHYREEDGQVYVLPQDSLEEFLVYDFNLEIGDKFHPKWGEALELDSVVLVVKSIEQEEDINGNLRKEFRLQGEGDFNDFRIRWIEGIGDRSWPFFYPHYQSGIQLGGFYTLGCFAEASLNYVLKEPGCVIVSNKNLQNQFDISIGPNPSNSIFNISSNDVIKNIQVLNTRGESIVSASPNLNYFELDLNLYESGIYYLILVTSDNIDIVKKVYKL